MIAGAVRAKLVGGLLTALGATAFAVSVTAMPVFYRDGGNVQTVLVARYGLVLVISLAIVAAGRVSLRLSRAELIAALGSGIVFGAGGLSAIAAYALLPVSLGVLIFYIFPLLTAILEAPLDRRMPSPSQILCLLVALAGIALALELGELDADPRGIAMSALGALGVAIAFVWSGRALGATHPGAVNVFRSLAALGLAVGFGFAVGSGFSVHVGAIAWAAFLVAVLASVLAFITMFAGVERIGATPAAMIMNLEPVVTMGLAAIVLAEPISAMKLAGGAMVIAAVLVSQWLALAPAEQAKPPVQTTRTGKARMQTLRRAA